MPPLVWSRLCRASHLRSVEVSYPQGLRPPVHPTRHNVRMHRTKLVPPPRRRWKVSEAARELGLAVGDVMAGLREIGEYATGPRDLIEEPVFVRLAALFGVTTSTTDEEVDPIGSEAPQAGERGPGLTRPPPLPRRDNNPYREPEPRPRDVQQVSHGARHSENTVEDYRSVGQRRGPRTAFEEHEWALRAFSEPEKDVWLAAGLKETQAKLAEALRAAGLRPHELAQDLDGWTVLDRVNLGEDAQAVASFLARKRRTEAG